MKIKKIFLLVILFGGLFSPPFLFARPTWVEYNPDYTVKNWSYFQIGNTESVGFESEKSDSSYMYVYELNNDGVITVRELEDFDNETPGGQWNQVNQYTGDIFSGYDGLVYGNYTYGEDSFNDNMQGIFLSVKNSLLGVVEQNSETDYILNEIRRVLLWILGVLLGQSLLRRF